MFSRKNILIKIIAFSMLSACFYSVSGVADNADVSTFHPRNCNKNLPVYPNTQCGYVTVPLSYDEPFDRSLKIDIAILKSDKPQSTPLYYLEGGPGGNGLIPHDKHILEMRKDRDIVLISQRGTGMSEPSQDCPELGIYTSTDLRVLKQCQQNLLKKGVDLGAYNIQNSAHDINRVRLALKSKKVNLYGVSYGTLLALQVLKYHPEGVRSVILDSTLAPQAHFLEEGAKNGLDTIQRFLLDCRKSQKCNQAYPNLKKELFYVLKNLSEHPQQVNFTWKGKKINSTISAGDILDSFDGNYDAIPYLPAVIHILAAEDKNAYSIDKKDFVFGKVFRPDELAPGQFSLGNYWSVACQSFLTNESLVKTKRANSKLPIGLQNHYNGYANEQLSGCQIWFGKIKRNKEIQNPIHSKKPVLFIAGEYDGTTNGTPPKWAMWVKADLRGKSYFYLFPRTGHVVLRAGSCPISISSDFLKNPEKTPNAQCINNMRDEKDRQFYVL